MRLRFGEGKKKHSPPMMSIRQKILALIGKSYTSSEMQNGTVRQIRGGNKRGETSDWLWTTDMRHNYSFPRVKYTLCIDSEVTCFCL